MRHLKITSIVILSSFITACSAGEKATDKAEYASLPIIEVRATDENSMPIAMEQATFIPNNVASWLGHIILRGKDGSIWRTTTEGRTPRKVSDGPYSDIIGLNRQNASGVFLAIKQNGKLAAFIEADDDGNFKPMIMSGKLGASFCTVTDSIIWTQDGDATKTAYSYETSDNALNLSQSDIETVAPELCDSDKAVIAGRQIILSSNQEKALKITNGLSVNGTDAPDFVALTDAAMGSVFNNGLLVVGDTKDDRIILISLEYILREIAVK